jgi:hypothetical protein
MESNNYGEKLDKNLDKLGEQMCDEMVNSSHRNTFEHHRHLLTLQNNPELILWVYEPDPSMRKKLHSYFKSFGGVGTFSIHDPRFHSVTSRYYREEGDKRWTLFDKDEIDTHKEKCMFKRHNVFLAGQYFIENGFKGNNRNNHEIANYSLENKYIIPPGTDVFDVLDQNEKYVKLINAPPSFKQLTAEHKIVRRDLRKKFYKLL